MCLGCVPDERALAKPEEGQVESSAPDGKLELAVGVNEGKVFIGFGGVAVTHLGLSPHQAVQFAASVNEAALIALQSTPLAKKEGE